MDERIKHEILLSLSGDRRAGFTLVELPGANGNAYSSSRRLLESIKYNQETKIAGWVVKNGEVCESVTFEVPDGMRGGMIIFSTEINAKKLSKIAIVDKFKKFVRNFRSARSANKRLDKIVLGHKLEGWTVGRFLRGRYTAKNGEFFDENSLSLEITGVNQETLMSIAEELCVEFDQESVMVKTYDDNKIMFVNSN
jgi:hypothetical protein